MTLYRKVVLASLLLMGCPKAPAVPSVPFPATPPTVTPDDSWMPTPPTVHETVAGGSLWHAHRPGLPLVSLRLVLPGGSSLDPADRPGLTALSDAMLLRGAADRDSAAFSAALQTEAITLHVDTRRTATVVSLDCTTDALPTALDLLADALKSPRFDADEVGRAQQQRVQARKDAADDPRTVASEVGWRLWFGPDSPHAHPPDGSIAGLQAADAGALADSWARRAHPASARWIVVGDLESSQLIGMLEARLSDWTGSDGLAVPLELPHAAEHRAVRAERGVETPGAVHRVGGRGPLQSQRRHELVAPLSTRPLEGDHRRLASEGLLDAGHERPEAHDAVEVTELRTNGLLMGHGVSWS